MCNHMVEERPSETPRQMRPALTPIEALPAQRGPARGKFRDVNSQAFSEKIAIRRKGQIGISDGQISPLDHAFIHLDAGRPCQVIVAASCQAQRLGTTSLKPDQGS